MDDLAYQVPPSETATWTDPGSIEGEPHEVRDLTVQQLRVVTRQYAELARASVVQIRNAGITGRPGINAEEVALENWLASDEGRACKEIVGAVSDLLRAAQTLS